MAPPCSASLPTPHVTTLGTNPTSYSARWIRLWPLQLSGSEIPAHRQPPRPVQGHRRHRAGHAGHHLADESYRSLLSRPRPGLLHPTRPRTHETTCANKSPTWATRSPSKPPSRRRSGNLRARLWGQCSTCSKSAYRSIIMSLPLIWEVSSAVAMSSWPGSWLAPPAGPRGSRITGGPGV